jgi:type II restriction enzyme
MQGMQPISRDEMGIGFRGGLMANMSLTLERLSPSTQMATRFRTANVVIFAEVVYRMSDDDQWRLGVREERAPFESEPQNARVWTEAWVKNWMYCPRCGAQQLKQYPNNNPAADFCCTACAEDFELKGQKGKFSNKVVNGAYASMSRKIEDKANASLILLQYDRERLQVRNLTVIPKHFFTLGLLERRNPLGPNARRAGWIGCNILLDQVPAIGRIPIVEERQARAKELVLDQWKRLSFLENEAVAGRGWLIEVMHCVELIGRAEFTLAEVYSFEDRLARLYPENAHVRQKIRQQLQVLRDGGYLEFLGRGVYRLRHLAPAA